MKKNLFLAAVILTSITATAQNADSIMLRRIYNEALSNGQCYENLRNLCKSVGARLSGSANAEKAVVWGQEKLNKIGANRVFLQDVMVPHWVRGNKEDVVLVEGGYKRNLSSTALGGSIATAPEGIMAQVVEVKNFDELKALGEANVKGKIVFFNRPLDPTKIRTFEAYGGAVDQRGKGAIEAAKLGALAAVVRSMGSNIDDNPHTGAMRYDEKVIQIPAVAISTQAAEILSKSLKKDPSIKLFVRLNCETRPDTLSHNVVAEIKGSESADIIVVGGHLDSWDLAEGAHDDGAGIVQSIEALRILNSLGYKPKHMLRTVFFMNEENGLRGGLKYAELADKNKEKHIAAIESDAGGFSPRGYSMGAKKEQFEKVLSWKPLLEPYGLHQFGDYGGGADISPLEKTGVPCFELIVDSQRYFDVHHTPIDKFENVNKRELELGAASLAALIYLIDQYGL